jgi:peptidyl-tRNA hydrolase, PTH1 family
MNNSPFLFVGLGNPGSEYEKTRHNIGAYVVYNFALELGLTFKKESKVEGYIAKGSIEGRRVIFLLPTTYMNLSGTSVRKCMSYFDVEIDNLLILSDDTYIPFADLRIKLGGSAGGHNGLKDVENKLGTKDYPRLRIGIGEKTEEDLSDYVLARFTKKEQEQMDNIATGSISLIKREFLQIGGDNQKQKQKEDLRRN